MGSTEEYVEHIGNWGKYTTGHFEQEVLPGNHFFVFDHLDNLKAIIEKARKLKAAAC
jgi:surfactin synthase thioesterase subunit